MLENGTSMENLMVWRSWITMLETILKLGFLFPPVIMLLRTLSVLNKWGFRLLLVGTMKYVAMLFSLKCYNRRLVMKYSVLKVSTSNIGFSDVPSPAPLHIPASDDPEWPGWCEPAWYNSVIEDQRRKGKNWFLLPRLSPGLHVVGEVDVVRPDVVLPLPEPEDPTENPAAVYADPHVEINIRRLHDRPEWLSCRGR